MRAMGFTSRTILASLLDEGLLLERKAGPIGIALESGRICASAH
jgi:hypothetical protein